MSNKTPKEQLNETASAPKNPKSSKSYFIVVILVIFGALVIYNGVSSLFENTTRLITPNGFITVEVVDTPDKRTLGLSGREYLSEKAGMLFVFDNTNEKNCFWMKDMNLSIDMVWMNEQREVVTVTPNVTPESYPETYCPDEPAKYGLELANGNAEKLDITPGVKLRW